MNPLKELEKDFTEYSFGMSRALGMPDLHANLLSILFLEPEPVSIEELSKRTGYSLSAVSTAMNFLQNINQVKKTRKARKIYYTTEKDGKKVIRDMLKKVREAKFKPASEHIPKIIEKYEKIAKKNKELDDRLEIIKRYHEQMLKVDKILEKALDEMKEI